MGHRRGPSRPHPHRRDGDGRALTSDEIDAWLRELVGDERDVALVAVGSHGRGDRAPHSDLDLVLLHRGRKDIAAVADRVWYPIWDRKLGLDHSVRTVKEAVAVAEDDLKAALGLLDLRFVAGDRDLADDVATRVRELWQRRARRWLPALLDATRERHERFGEVAFLLEPELKEGKGGLRDAHVLRAAALATPVLQDVVGDVDDPASRLAAVRDALHRRTGRALDRLVLQEQDGVAEALGFGDADMLMAEVSAAGRAIGWTGDDAWRRVAAWLDGPRGRGASTDRPLAAGVVLRDGEVVCTDLERWVDAVAAAAAVDRPIARETLRRMAADAPSPPDPWPEHVRHAFVVLLGAGRPTVDLLEALDQHDLLTRLLPEWGTVRHLPQRNAYHRFTVDRHLMETARQAAALARTVARPDLLLVGALLHDIGKGSPGDHTDAGVELVTKIGPRMGFAPADVDVLVAMVRHHLLLPDVATRRDLDDPATARAVAEAVGDPGVLELLQALTEADSIATGPSAWSEWKAGLVADLVDRARAVLTGGTPRVLTRDLGALAPRSRVKTGRGAGGVELEDVPEGVHGEGSTLRVNLPDRPGLFCKVAGVLALNGLDVRSARVGPGAGDRAVEVFEVEPATGGEPDWTKVAADVEAVLAGRLPLEARLAARARSYASRYRPTAAATAPPRVIVDTQGSERATIVEVRAPDGVGVLHAITRAIAELGLDVRFARVSTLGHEVVDAFYVVGAGGDKVTDPAQQRALEESILHALDQVRRT